MHPNALLDLATELLREVLRLDTPADGVVSAFFRQQRELGPRERHTLAETTYPCCAGARCCCTWPNWAGTASRTRWACP